MKSSHVLSLAMAAAILMPVAAVADDDGRYRIVNIQRDIQSGSEYQTVHGTMMVDSQTGKSWILDEQKGRWVPVGFRAPNLGSDVTVTPGK